MKKILFLFVTVFFCSFSARQLSAQENIRETPGAGFLEIIPDAHSASLGGISSAVTPGAFGIFGNAAANVFSTDRYGAGASLSARKDFSDGNLYSAGAFFNINEKHGLSAGFRYFANPKVDLGEDGTLKPREMAVDLAYGLKVARNLSLSLTARYILSDMKNDPGAGKAEAFAVDLGVYYQKGMESFSGGKWNIGLQASNFGSKLDYDNSGNYKQPARVKLGGSAFLPFSENHKLTASAHLAYRVLPSDFSTFEFGAGLDYNLYRYASVRAGYHVGDKEKGLGNFATLGAGASYAGFRLDASYWAGVPNQDFKNIVFLTLSASF